MTMAQFRKSNFVQMIHSLGPNVDLNSVRSIHILSAALLLTRYRFQTRDCFSYKHFYVLYCKFWTLDDDHDLIISEEDLAKYNQGALGPSVIQRIMQCGRIAAFARDTGASTSSSSISCEATMEQDEAQQTPITLTYLDYICKYYSAWITCQQHHDWSCFIIQGSCCQKLTRPHRWLLNTGIYLIAIMFWIWIDIGSC